MMAGVDLVHVALPRRAGWRCTDLLSGQVQVMFGVLPSSIGYIRAGRLRALAVTTAQRARRCCRTSRPWTNFCRATRPAAGMASALPRATPAEIIEQAQQGDQCRLWPMPR